MRRGIRAVVQRGFEMDAECGESGDEVALVLLKPGDARVGGGRAASDGIRTVEGVFARVLRS